MKEGLEWETSNMYAYYYNINNGGSLGLNTHYGVNFWKPNTVKDPIPFVKNGIMVTPWTRNICYITLTK